MGPGCWRRTVASWVLLLPVEFQLMSGVQVSEFS